MAFISIFVSLLLVGVTACGAESTPKNTAFVRAASVSAIATDSAGGVEWANGTTGQIFSADKNGQNSKILNTVPVLSGMTTAVTGLTTDPSDHVFAAWVNADSQLTVGQVSPGVTRILWQGPKVSTRNLAGALAYSPNGRVVLSVGQAGDASINGNILSFDPNGAATQQPNAIGTNYTVPNGLAYSFDKVLWVADYKPSDKGVLAVSGPNGATGTVTNFDASDMPMGMTQYDAQEMAICLGGSHQLKRYLLSDGIQALPSRVLANDCVGSVGLLKDGRLVYATANGISVTSI